MSRTDIAGLRFGAFVAVRRDDARSVHHREYWICTCDCGVVKSVRDDGLKSGHSKSCGCQKPVPIRRIDLIGQRFGKLLVVSRAPSVGKTARWNCICDCGRDTVKSSNVLRMGTVKSCGCLRTLHGHCTTVSGKVVRSPEYFTWRSMLARCTNLNHHAWDNYGGRGITVCEDWHVFSNFLRDMGDRPDGKTLDRINNDAGYFKENCRWATRSEQQKNRRGFKK